MKALIGLIIGFFLVILVGKYTREVNHIGYIFVAIISLIQVAIVLLYMFNMEVPTPPTP